jgi:hypothetical protein
VGSGSDVRPATIGDLPIRAMTRRVDSPIGTIYIQVIQDRTAEQQTLDALLRVLIVGGGVVVLVAVAFGAVYARRALVPIRESLRPANGPPPGSGSSPPTRATSCARRSP